MSVGDIDYWPSTSGQHKSARFFNIGSLRAVGDPTTADFDLTLEYKPQGEPWRRVYASGAWGVWEDATYEGPDGKYRWKVEASSPGASAQYVFRWS